MAAVHDLLSQIQDEALRSRLEKEVNKLTHNKKFGLVFEEHLPECTPLYDIEIKKGVCVARRDGLISEIYEVATIEESVATCINRNTREVEKIPLDELVCIAEFGEPIYPYLKPIDSICNAPDSDLWHTLIEADNYHALQLLAYLYAGKVDCIYIDPPYNTGARDWKYNNDYVDGADAYRHSKWLSFMQRRLGLAKKLLNPTSSVLIIAIDEKEYLHLGCLLEEMFSEARIQMVTTVIKPEGTQRVNEFSRTNEFLFFVFIGDAVVLPWKDMTTDDTLEKYNDTIKRLPYRNFRRTNSANVRSSRPNQFYPVFVDEKTKKIVGVGEVMTPEVKQSDIVPPDGTFAVFPLRDSGEEMIWYKTPSSLKYLLEKGYAYAQTKNGVTTIQYLSSGPVNDIESGKIVITGKTDEGALLGYYTEEKLTMPKSTWMLKTHNARDYGSVPLRDLFAGERRFTFPKSLYAVHDCIYIATKEKKDALVLDFFAGSGTTAHAVNLINAEDGGTRRCIMVTNNELSEEEADYMAEKGYRPGDEQWENLGIARYVTWPRMVCSIEGHDIKGNPLSGKYVGTELPLSDGFKTNAAYYKLGFLDKQSVALGKQLEAMIPLLWMKAGAKNACPDINQIKDEAMIVLPDNHFAILVDERYYMDFLKEIEKCPEIETIYFITDSDAGYRDMIAGLEDKNTYQLYKDYLDNFRINTGWR